jgi:hypothetical protein
MFCPSCGRDDSHKRKFCPSCGTNLEAISHALSDEAEGALSKLDQSLNKFIARYAEHVFKDAPVKALDRKVSRSWQILGQGALTSLFDMALFTIMTVLLPFRFFILLIRTPIKLLSERSKSRKSTIVELKGKDASYLPDTQSQPWLLNTISSVTEHTTVNLKEK